MSIASYSDLSTAIDDYTERSYSQARKDIFIGNAEAKFNRRITSTYRANGDTTLTTDANGEVTLPSGFVGFRALKRDANGVSPLVGVSYAALLDMNPYAESGEPVFYAVNGTTLKVAPVYQGDFLATYATTLTPLSGTNASNWLLLLAPDVYLMACLAEEKMFTNDYQMADGLYGRALSMLDEVVAQDQVGQFYDSTFVYGDMP